jgi:glycosyltransferase involved in cell wall biosynthesis
MSTAEKAEWLNFMLNTNRSSINRFFAIAYASFWATIFFVRIVEFIALFYNRYPAIIIHNTHIHHFISGFLLIIISVGLSFFSEIHDAFTATTFGIGLGLVADEFLYWTLGRFNYWSYVNCAGILLIALALLAAVFFTLDPDWSESKINKTKSAGTKNDSQNSTDENNYPLISVVVPAHNEELFLPDTLKSLQEQSYENFEIIVVDNNSTDATASIAKEHGARVITEQKVGVAAARQAGFIAANGTIIATTDADTIVPENWLEKIAAKFLSRPEIVAYGGLYSLYSGPLSARIIFPDIAYLAWCIDRLINGVWVLPGANMAVRRQAFLAIGGFDLNKEVLEDADLSKRISKFGPVVFELGNLVRTSGRRYGKGFIKGLAPYATGKIAPKSVNINKKFATVREEKSTNFNFMFALIPTMLLLCLFLLSGAAVKEAREKHHVPSFAHILKESTLYHIHVEQNNIHQRYGWKKYISNF